MNKLKLFAKGTYGNIYEDNNGDMIKRNKDGYCSTFLRELAFSQFYNVPKSVKFQFPDIYISYENLGIPLTKYYGKLCDTQKKFIIGEIIRQVRILHDNNIYHGDLMSGNILYDGVKVSIIDYGMSSFSINNSRVLYNDYFKAPESIGKETRAGLANDIWAIGCIIMLLYSKNLNAIQGIHNFYNKPVFPFCLLINDPVINSLIKLTVTDLTRRASITDLYKMFFGKISPPIYNKWNYFYDKFNRDSFYVRVYKYLKIVKCGLLDEVIDVVSKLKIHDVYKFNITNVILMYLLSHPDVDNLTKIISNCISINYAIFDIDIPKYTNASDLTMILNDIYPCLITKPNSIIGERSDYRYCKEIYSLCMIAYLIK
jgi:serine/threonine protein kinase